MNLGLRGKPALVTGSSRGIGLAIAQRLLMEGCPITLCARNAEPMEEARDQLKKLCTDATIHLIQADLSQKGASADVVREAAKRMNGLQLLVNNVGTNRRMPFEATTDEDWDALLATNFRGPLEATRAAFPFLRENGGSVVFNASIYGREFGGRDMSLYHVSKAALIALSKSLAVEWVGQGIRVNTIAPGSIWFEGGSWDRRLKSDPEGMKAFTERELPLGRLGRADEIADAVAFLLSERASLVNGTCWNVDGGQSRSML
ncbi:MAG: SDR family oxidoreductase [Puniceicoccaceae bacterium]